MTLPHVACALLNMAGLLLSYLQSGKLYRCGARAQARPAGQSSVRAPAARHRRRPCRRRVRSRRPRRPMSELFVVCIRAVSVSLCVLEARKARRRRSAGRGAIFEQNERVYSQWRENKPRPAHSPPHTTHAACGRPALHRTSLGTPASPTSNRSQRPNQPSRAEPLARSDRATPRRCRRAPRAQWKNPALPLSRL